jgi:hypothetical protein
VKKFRTSAESAAAASLARLFDTCPDSTEIKLENFPKYVRRQHLKRFLALYEIFKMILPIKGSIVECGVFKGFGVMSWAKLSAILEPENLTRRIYAFDTFAGFPAVSGKDKNVVAEVAPGGLRSDSFDEIQKLVTEYDQDRFLGHIDKEHPHLLISLLFLDMDLYEPTKAAIKHFVARMPRGAVIAFDELDNPMWPGETLALLEALDVRRVSLRRLEWDPYISYAVLD